MRPATPDLSIVIVNWNVRDLLYGTLASIERGRGELTVQTIVVDSASQDDSVAMVAREFPDVTLIACPQNVGFARGNNIGFAVATARFILLLNPDTIVVDDALPVMVDRLRGDTTIGALGPQLLNPDGTVQSSRRRFPTFSTGIFESTWLEGAAPSSVLDSYYMADQPDDRAVEVDWVTGAAIMTRREVLETVGGLDEGYFMYSEELDWCRRVKEGGWRIMYEPAAQIIHYVGQSSEQAVTARHINFQQAKLRYFRKYHGQFAAAVLRRFLLLSYASQIAVEGVKGALGHKRELRRQRVQAYLEVLRSGLHPAGYS